MMMMKIASGSAKQTLVSVSSLKTPRGGSIMATDNPPNLIGICMEQRTILWLFNIAMENGPFIDDFPS